MTSDDRRVPDLSTDQDEARPQDGAARPVARPLANPRRVRRA
jgi:hypothetical protein